MLDDSPISAAIFWVAVALLFIGAIILVAARGSTSRIVAAFVALSLGMTLWIVALWVDNSAWLPGRIIATITCAGMLLLVARLIIRVTAKNSSGEDSD